MALKRWRSPARCRSPAIATMQFAKGFVVFHGIFRNKKSNVFNYTKNSSLSLMKEQIDVSTHQRWILMLWTMSSFMQNKMLDGRGIFQ